MDAMEGGLEDSRAVRKKSKRDKKERRRLEEELGQPQVIRGAALLMALVACPPQGERD